jgi:uncharacterized RDD family membrane protein YckC
MRNINRPLVGPWKRRLIGLVLAGAAIVAGARAVPAQAPEAPAAPAPVEAPPAPAPPVPDAARPAPAPPVPAAARPASAPQPVAPPGVPDVPEVSEAPAEPGEMVWRRPVVRVGQNYDLRVGEAVREVVVVFGSATIAGEVDRDVVVVFGSARLASTAVIRGSLVATGAGVVIEQGAVVERDMVVTGGGVDAPPGFQPGREFVVVGLPGMARQVESVVPYFTRGLLWGRLIVPSLPWMWAVVAIIVLVYLVFALLFDRPVRACRQVLVDRPLSSFLVGLLVLVLIGPASFVLAVSIIGIPVVPFLMCGVLIAALLGKIGVTRWLGSTLVTESDPDSRAQAVRSFAIGTVVILLAYMVPVLGILVWAVGGMFGLGAATLAFSSGLRRENPSRKRERTASIPVAGGVGEAAAQPLQASDVPFRSDFQSGVPPMPTESIPLGYPPAPSAAAMSGVGVAVAPVVDLLTMPKAPFLDRLAAFALDVLLVFLTFNLLDMDSMRAFVTLLLGYHIIFWALKATTVGGIICNLRVVRTDGRPLTFPDALIRGFSAIFSIAALGIGCFWILYDADSQAWHDRFAGTWVVKVPRHLPL